MEYIIDRFEGKKAVCEAEDGTTTVFDKELIPDDAGEGDVLVSSKGNLFLNKEATEARRKRIRDKFNKLIK